MLPGYHYGLYYSNAYALNQYFAHQGYVVLSINFRSGIGYGLDFREALNYGASGASEFNDVLGAGLYLKGRADVDEGKIALWGASYGGYLTAMGLSRASDLFACGVDIHGVHDWNEGIRNFIPTYIPEHHPEVRDLAFRSSPEYSIDSWKSPVLLIHGDDDRNVNFAESVRIIEKLRERNVYTEQLVLPDEVHSFLLHKSWVKVYEATYDFIHRMLHRKK
jgi:dipeptidyl aminopeptidase/acylaminoacyl peptidase